jgi:ATP-dependent DNA ligase
MRAIAIAAPMEAESRPDLPTGPGWWYEPKWDGFRCLAFRDRAGVRLQAKSGKPLTRYFPEIATVLGETGTPPFVLDGELIGASFEAMQLRLHPAQSRIERLAREAPAVLAAFDLLQTPRADLTGRAFGTRRKALETFMAAAPQPRLQLTPGTSELAIAQGWLAGGMIEGVIAKRLDLAYRAGERAMVKVKRARTADCVVGGFRYGAGSSLVGSLLLGLYDREGRLDHVGFTSGLAAAERPTLTRRLEALAGGDGFTGTKPGGPSRWSRERDTAWTPLVPELVVEVGFDHVSGGRFRHGTRLLRFRPDKAPGQCRMDQLA